MSTIQRPSKIKVTWDGGNEIPSIKTIAASYYEVNNGIVEFYGDNDVVVFVVPLEGLYHWERVE